MFNVYVDFIITIITFTLVAMNVTAAFVAATLTWEKWAATPPEGEVPVNRATTNLRHWMGWSREEVMPFIHVGKFYDVMFEYSYHNYTSMLRSCRLSPEGLDRLIEDCCITHNTQQWVDLNKLAEELDILQWKGENWF